MMTYYEFKELQDALVKVNEHLGSSLESMCDEERKPIDRVNDIALIVFMAFALDAFCSGYTTSIRLPRRERDQGEPMAKFLRKLEKRAKAQAQSRLDDIHPHVMLADPVITVRNLWAHGAGRRSGLNHPEDLPPDVLINEYGFKPDGDTNDPDTRWWPTRHVSFSACVAPLNELARQVDQHIAPLTSAR
jgi:hypothetical protein